MAFCESCGFRVSSQARGFFGDDVVSYRMEKGFAAGIGTNGMWRRESAGAGSLNVCIIFSRLMPPGSRV